MKINFLLIFFAFSATIFGQNKKPEEYGFRYMKTLFREDTVNILLKSKKGEEQKAKPLFLFCQGSLPKPLIIVDGLDGFGTFPFNPDSLTNDYHVAIIGKPYIPVSCNIQKLNSDFTYTDSSGKFPKKYIERNLLSYYVDRNMQIINFLQDQNWVLKHKLVVAGHSEGSSIAAKLAFQSPKVTHLIYSGGNPLGRILSIIEQQRSRENDSTNYAEDEILYWQKIVADPENMDMSNGDTYRCTYEFSIPPIQFMQKLKIPVLICYGTKDVSSPFNDYFRVEMLRQKKKNFTFKAYIGTEHNYFPLKAGGEINYGIFNWDKVAGDWRKWLIQQ